VPVPAGLVGKASAVASRVARMRSFILRKRRMIK
jgi:hypothetical protein